MKKKLFLFGLAFLFIFFGGLIYLCFRPPTILLFRWLDLIGFNYLLFQNIDINPPPFFIFNLPNVLFILFGYVIIYIIWEYKKSHYIFYNSLITLLAIIYEITTHDIDDIIAIFLTYIICLIFYLKYLRIKYEK
jgi:hypothetical protein